MRLTTSAFVNSLVFIQSTGVIKGGNTQSQSAAKAIKALTDKKINFDLRMFGGLLCLACKCCLTIHF